MRKHEMGSVARFLVACLFVAALGLCACAGPTEGGPSAPSSSASASSSSASTQREGLDGSAQDAGPSVRAVPDDGGSAQGRPTDAAPAGDAVGQPEQPSKIAVSVTIDSTRAQGKSFGTISRAVTLDKGASAFDALKASGVSLNGSGSYVTAINGLAEKAYGPTSGWTYYVNGRFPNKPAGSFKLDSDAIVLWFYVTGPDDRP